VKYGQLTTVLVNAVKELKQENDDLKAQVQNQLSQVIKQLNQMQKQLAAMRTLICSQNPQSGLCK
jgi:flagellar hook-associated protein FlgK